MVPLPRGVLFLNLRACFAATNEKSPLSYPLIRHDFSVTPSPQGEGFRAADSRPYNDIRTGSVG